MALAEHTGGIAVQKEELPILIIGLFLPVVVLWSIWAGLLEKIGSNKALALGLLWVWPILQWILSTLVLVLFLSYCGGIK